MGSLKKQVLDLKGELEALWPELLSEISSDPEYADMVPAVTWLQKVMAANVPEGKKYRALLGIRIYDEVADPETREEQRLILISGWCLEVFQAAALTADDIMDESQNRRGKSCWYKQDSVGVASAINDSFLLESVGYLMLYKYFDSKDYFPAVLRHTHKMVMRTVLGQSLDIRASTEFKLDTFTPELYDQIVTNKTSYYTFYTPAATAMIVARIKDQSLFDAVLKVSLRIGFLFQAQDDFLDCFGKPEVTGKIGTDIQDAKCTWLIVEALQKVSEKQRITLEDNYGRKCDNAANRVKEVFREVDLERAFREFERKTYKETIKMIEALPKRLPKNTFFDILDALYQREK